MVNKPFFRNLLVKVSCISFLLGCTTVTVEPDLPCPDRPELMPLPVDLQIQMPPDAVWIVAENQLLLKKYAKALEARAGCTDNQ